ncbi:class I SAM-dependent methyltransferase [Terriglobus sp. ADX1]|uniref:class I SAM-dependent methyltransferase n=1 Tax=Terriglobus sp. ADX1 TaxID=2794063 RepID=UPI002FE598D6
MHWPKSDGAAVIPAKRKKRRGPTPRHPFDLEHGTDTGNLIPGEDLETGHAHDRHITAYHGVAPSLFHKLMARWQTFAQHPVERTAFVDIGAGKGRAMFLAAEMPFRRIVGVELHPALATAARSNIEIWQAAHTTPPMRLEEADAMRLRMPAGPCLLFLFNPFDMVLMDRLLDRLQNIFRDRPGDLDLLYVNDEQRELMSDYHKGFRELWRGRIHHSREDRVADKAIIEHDAGDMYVTTGYEDCGIWRLET